METEDRRARDRKRKQRVQRNDTGISRGEASGWSLVCCRGKKIVVAVGADVGIAGTDRCSVGYASGRYAERSPLNRDGSCGDVSAWLGKTLVEIISDHRLFFLLMSGG